MADDLARHVNVILEAMQTRITTVDEQYKDLPARVTRLEEEVFRPKRQRRR